MDHDFPLTRRTGRQAAVGLLTVGLLAAALAAANSAAGAPAAPTAAAAANSVVVPAWVNMANAGQLSITGTTDTGADVTIAVQDEDAGTADVMGTATPDPQGAWATDLDLSGLTDGSLTVWTSLAGDPAGTPVKDTDAPQEPTAFPDDGEEFATPTQVEIASTDPSAVTHFTTGTPAAPDPTASDPVAPAQLLVATTEQVKAISFDAAGNPSPVMTMNFVVTGSPVTPGGGTPPVTPPVVTPPVTTPPVTTPPVVTPPIGKPPVVTPAAVRLRIVRVSPLGREYVSVRNTGTVAVNLKGWKLKDRAGHSLTLPRYTLKPGATIKIYTGTGARAASKLFLAKKADLWGTHDTVKLVNPKGVTVVSLRY